MPLASDGSKAVHVDRVLDRLMSLHPKVIDLSLDRVYRLLQSIGSPHLNLPPVIHVAGTNGKGSTIAFLRAMLSRAGYRVDCYISPHLVRFNERILLDGYPIDDAILLADLEACEEANGDQPITYFEITTAAAFRAFARSGADVLLLETGLGGRLDATNVIDRPAATVITRISFDHMSFLGDTIEAIAGEKAGILKADVPAIIAPQGWDAATATLTARAESVGAPISRAGVHWRFAPAMGDGLRFEGRRWTLDLPRLALGGDHQRENAATALACLEAVDGFTVPEEAVRKGLAETQWPARLQPLTGHPATASLPEGWEAWLDGGHNDSAGAALARVAEGWTDRPLAIVAGMISSKDPAGFLKPLAATGARFVAVPVPGDSAGIAPEDLANAARAAGFQQVDTAGTVSAALAMIAADANGGPATGGYGRVLICGSLYLAGAVLREGPALTFRQ